MPAKKSHEQFISEINIQQPTIQALGYYSDNRTKIKVKCKIDGYEWETTPNILLTGHGCPKCGGVKRRTHEEFISEISEINSSLEIFGYYKNNCTKLKAKCKIDGYEWETTPKNLLAGYGCPKCGGTQKKTHEEFIIKISSNMPNIEILGYYKNNHTKLKVKCKIDGYEWMATPNGLLAGHGCPKCGGTQKKTHEEFLDNMIKKCPTIEVIGHFSNMHTKLRVRCRIDGYEWKTTPDSLLNARNGCPKCSQRIPRTYNQFVLEMQEEHPNIEIIGSFTGTMRKIALRCKIDGHEWKATPNSLLSSHSGCPRCRSSRGEKMIAKILDQKSITYISQYKFPDCRNKLPLIFDFYLPDKNICIEYDGAGHFIPVDFFGGEETYEIRCQNDRIKDKYCRDNGINLIRIPYTATNIKEILRQYNII